MMMRYSLGLPQFFSRWPNALRCRPIIGLSMALVVAIWSCTWVHINDERVSLQRASLQELVNLANLLEKNIARTIGEIDRLVVFVRSLHMQGVARDDWSKLIPARHVIEQQAIQISVVDARGLVIASSLGALPDTPIDVSDREHFRIHQGTAQDLLFISKPVVGRNSKKISIQLTRRFWNESGEFAGVIVASLDPIQLARTYDGIELGDGGGFAMVGTDDVIRAGSGVFARDVGYGIKDTHFRGNMLLSDDGVAVALVASGGRHRATSSRPVSGYPLFVIVAGRDVAQDPQWSALKWKYALGAGLLSLVVFVTMLVGLDWQRRSETRASYFARHDSLTGLANRAKFIEFLERTLNSRSSSNAFALHVIDLDKFKHVNDAFGHSNRQQTLAIGDTAPARERTTDRFCRETWRR